MKNLDMISTIKSILDELGIKADLKSQGFNFRCISCGDSKKSSTKKRGWILLKENQYTYFCHNCGLNFSLQKFLKEYHPKIYKKYQDTFNKFTQKLEFKNTKIIKLTPPKKEFDVVEDLMYILKDVAFPIYSKEVPTVELKQLQLSALKFLTNRKIPTTEIGKFWIAHKNFDYLDAEGVHKKYYLENRVILPFYKDNKVYAFQGRIILDNIEPKYLTIKRTNALKIFNIFNVDKTKPIVVTEGPIDALFVENGIATCGTISPQSQQYQIIKKYCPELIWAFDNDATGMKRTKEFLTVNEKCFLWSEVKEWSSCKDFNDVAKNLYLTKEQITDIILKNSKSGLSAKIKLKLAKKEKKCLQNPKL